MYGPMCRSLMLVAVIFVKVLDAQESNNTKNIIHDELNFRRQGLDVPEHYVVRCSRRFAPGVCKEAVVSVWTFDFLTQNCTERLGCRYATRSNRFKSYSRCMRRCKHLNRIYTQVLQSERVNNSLLHQQNSLKVIPNTDNTRREGDDEIGVSDEYDDIPIPSDEDQPRDKEDYMETHGNQPLRFPFDEEENEMDMAVDVAPDIDYVFNPGNTEIDVVYPVL